MKSRLLGAGLAAAAAVAFAAPAHAQSVDTYYFHCAGGDPFKVQNLTAIAPGQAFVKDHGDSPGVITGIPHLLLGR